MELHEDILMYLYERRHSEEYPDLLQNFKDFGGSLYETVGELSNKGFIKVIYPFLGVGVYDHGTGQITYSSAEKDDYIKAKLTIDGIDYVNKNLNIY